MKNIIRILSAPWLMGSLFVLMAAVMAMATFIENDHGTHAAKAIVYNSWWFELIFFLLAINMLGNIFNFNMWKLEKMPVFLFHVSFFIIIAGAAITRYVGYEGLLHIREGETESVMLSTDPFVTAEFRSGDESEQVSRLAFFSPASPREFKATLRAGDERVRIRSVAFVPNAVPQPVETMDGKPLAAIVFSDRMERLEHFIAPGEKITKAAFTLGFETTEDVNSDVFIKRNASNTGLVLTANQPFTGLNMEDSSTRSFEANTEYPFNPGLLYDFNGLRITVSRYYPSAIMRPVTLPGDQGSGMPHGVVFEVTHRGETQLFTAYGRNGRVGEPFKLNLPGGQLSLRFGALPIELPFSVRLNQFILERYPGSSSPSGYRSEITLFDSDRGIDQDQSVFMNNIVTHRGYRLYQSSYDQDEKGTVLSVNHDRTGTIITYFGYFLMTLGMMWALFGGKTRFRQLMSHVGKIHEKRKQLMTILLLVFSLTMVAQSRDVLPPAPDRDVADAFGTILVQDNGGRIKPLNSLHQEIALKLVKHHTFRGMTADQMVLGMFIHPADWQTFPLITVKDPQIRAILGITKDKAAFAEFFDSNRHYKLHQWVDAAHRQNPAARNKTEQELIKIDEQVNVFYLTQMGNLHRIFPSTKDSHLPWYTPTSQPQTLTTSDSLFVSSSVRDFIEMVRRGNNEDAISQLKVIDEYQRSHADEILPTDRVRSLELLYNRLSIFLWLATWFFALGGILVLLQFINLLKPTLDFKWIMRGGYLLLFLGFLYHTFGLILRWIVSGHAPWSNGYESMIFVGWAILFAAFVMARKSSTILPISGLFTGVVLMVAHLSWMNPHITNLVPVLQSYWLTLHVSVIIAGYGFFVLGALLGFMNLLITAVRNKSNFNRLKLTIDEFTAINEMSLTVGLYLMTIGSFLGGVWANESWGRYWGWDPKETWSLITIVLYAFILHMRFIPGLKGKIAFNTASLLTFGSVIMTYLGVNYYLAGLHSYAGGDPVPIPTFVYYSVAVIFVLIFAARWNDSKMSRVEGED
ncbi:c-type cytochrome biogenesis protein CcsB [Alkalitalea saponilacus]|uniref:Cytochrome c-type biogenesis protein CcsB n=1 Tax=Alkalitalea saponilacus TaxID=889453 RepID=A0A1T5HSR4_9BACT|nr:c-type cytochrome biogenesis protein CcsB [Alkalitalea saponilacus]ASB49248.1 c-type cytochrome biogenesis protein CcsB [Alkalitalea saponilacus]SKC23734.1 cytochrome c-type biogenesis protein CcsB [Alkalitalea saponilacus]